MTGILRVPRSRGVLSGVLLVLLGLWGGLIAFVGPYFDFAYTPDDPWVFTADRFWLHVAPAVATVLGGLIVLISANRAIAMFGAWLAALGGAWFIVGEPVSRLWTGGSADAAGTPIGGEVRQVAEQLAFFLALGALIVFFAALALGRFAVVGVREARSAAERDAGADAGRDPAAPAAHGRHERPVPRESSAAWAATQPVERPAAQPVEPRAQQPVAEHAGRPADPRMQPVDGPAGGPAAPREDAGQRYGADTGQPASGPAPGGRYARSQVAAPPVGAGAPADRRIAGRTDAQEQSDR